MALTQNFLDYLALEKRYSLHTVKAYKADLTLLSDYLDEIYSTSIDKANHSMIRSWLVNELNRGNTPRTVNRKITTLKSFFKFAQKEGAVKINPTLRLKSAKTSKGIPGFVTVDEMNKLLDAKEFSDDYGGKRDRLIVEIFYSTGIRLSELINIKIKDIDFSKKQLKVLGKRNKERIIPLTQELITSLEKFLEIRNSMKTKFNSYLLLTEKGRKLNPSLVYKTMNKLISSVTSLKKTSPHILRHTFATHMLNSGADLNIIKELLGHASLSATEVYTHNSIEKLKKVFNNAHPRA